MVRISDIMKTEIVVLSSDDTQIDAICKMAENGVTGLPVVSADGKLEGIVTEKDILAFAYRIASNEFELADVKTISDVMIRDVVHVRPDDNLADVCQLLMNYPFRRLLVVENDKVVGVVSRADIIKAACAELKKSVFCTS